MKPRFDAGRIALYAWTAAVLAFLALPLVVMLPLSLNAGSFLSFPLSGVSDRWYRELLTDPGWRDAFANSLIVGALTTLIATPVGTLAALGLQRLPVRARPIVAGLLAAPMVVPVVVVAVAAYLAFAPRGLANSLAGLVLVHSVLALPFVVIAVRAALEGYDATLLRAAASLGAGPAVAFVRVTVPLIAPGVAAGAVFAFMTSFDETVAALFLAGPEQRTLPLRMFDGVREQLSPAIAAAATLLVLASALLLGVAEQLRRRARRRLQRL